MDSDLQSIQQARNLAEAAYAAWQEFGEFSADRVERVLKAVSEAGASHAADLARMAVEETGFGNVRDKTSKNLFASEAVYRAMAPLRTIGIVGEDREKRILEVASPVGVVAGVIPSTNPTSTVLYKALIALKGRNGIVFSPHPAARKAILATVRLVAEAAVGAGAPEGLVACMETPTLAGTRELMAHPRIAVILATGGPGLVRAAYSAGKPAFGVGPGNVPAYIDRTADVRRAVGHVLAGKCFDNGTLCSSEQSVIADEAVREAVLAELSAGGAHICGPEDQARLEALIQTPRRTLNTDIVGRDAGVIAEMAGFTVPAGTRALVGLAGGVGPAHPLSMEKLSPVLAFYSVADWEAGCRLCIEILEYGGMGHTLALHTEDDHVVRQFALRKPAFRICVNTPAALGAVGYTTNLFPAMTLGCGAPGGNITSDNISPLHLINLKRVAWGVREPASPANSRPRTKASAAPLPERVGAEDSRQRIRTLVDGWLGRRAGASLPLSDPPPSSDPPADSDPRPQPSSDSVPASPPRGGAAPPLTSYRELDASPDPAPGAPSGPVDFVCEDDVRRALRQHASIRIHARTIITPSARDLAGSEGVFVTAD